MGAKGGFLEEVSLGTGYFIQGRNGGREDFTKQVSSKDGTNPRDPGLSLAPDGEKTESSRENLLCTYSSSPLFVEGMFQDPQWQHKLY